MCKAFLSPASEASREVANLTERKNPHTPVYGVKEFGYCLSICLSVCLWSTLTPIIFLCKKHWKCVFAFFISIWIAQHPNTVQNIQYLSSRLLHIEVPAGDFWWFRFHYNSSFFDFNIFIIISFIPHLF